MKALKKYKDSYTKSRSARIGSHVNFLTSEATKGSPGSDELDRQTSRRSECAASDSKKAMGNSTQMRFSYTVSHSHPCVEPFHFLPKRCSPLSPKESVATGALSSLMRHPFKAPSFLSVWSILNLLSCLTPEAVPDIT